VAEICEAAAHVAMLIARRFSVVTTLPWSVPAIKDRLKLAGLLAHSRPRLSMSGPGSLVLLGQYFVKPGLQAVPRWRYGVLPVKEREGVLQLSAVVAQFVRG
jgi:hypothetical protein